MSAEVDLKSPSDLKVTAQPLVALDIGAMRGQGGDQARVFEHTRMQVVREVAHVLGELDRPLLDR